MTSGGASKIVIPNGATLSGKTGFPDSNRLRSSQGRVPASERPPTRTTSRTAWAPGAGAAAPAPRRAAGAAAAHHEPHRDPDRADDRDRAHAVPLRPGGDPQRD